MTIYIKKREQRNWIQSYNMQRIYLCDSSNKIIEYFIKYDSILFEQDYYFTLSDSAVIIILCFQDEFENNKKSRIVCDISFSSLPNQIFLKDDWIKVYANNNLIIQSKIIDNREGSEEKKWR